MNTRQKLTIGIAAIFMVTLTIVGVTYAYFVTRVTGDDNTGVEVSTAELGDVEYVAGNNNGAKDENQEVIADLIKITGEEPGVSVYKTFSVRNNGDAGVAPSKYQITLKGTSAGTSFVHSANGMDGDTDVEVKCYNKTAGETLDLTSDYTDSTFVADDSVCRVASGKYNNFRFTLWSVSETEKAKYDTNPTLGTDPTGTLTAINNNTAVNGAETKTDYRLSFAATDTITEAITIQPGAGTNADDSIHHYVLKVEYVDNGMNQNTENLADLSLVVSIIAA